jgi:gluconokinase
VIVIVMGPTGAGKTTVGSLLASQLGWIFADADSYHPAANIDKMSRGIPLDDADRAPWLASIRNAELKWLAAKQNAVLACSALKHAYRDVLRVSSDVKIIYLKGSYELFAGRIHERHGHFAGEGILAGQFRDLEEPHDAISVDAALSTKEIVAEIRSNLGLT